MTGIFFLRLRLKNGPEKGKKAMRAICYIWIWRILPEAIFAARRLCDFPMHNLSRLDLYTQLNIVFYGVHRQKRVWMRATASPTAQNKAVEKYRFSNLVQMDCIIHHSTQNHERNPAVYRSSPYLAVFKSHFWKLDFYSFCVFLEKISVEMDFFCFFRN